VITGLNLHEVGALVFPTPAVRKLAGLADNATLKEVLESAPVQSHFQKVLDELAASGTGSANRVVRMHLMHEPPSIDKGEVTDKGSINQRAVLKCRDAMVNALHDGTLPFTLRPTENRK
jgi:feruloyl-CoA synthase